MATVLIAAADTTVLELIAICVSDLGHRVIRSSTGKRAWHALEDNPDIDLLITDVMMPEMDGNELVRIIRGNSRFSNVPIIMMSAVLESREMKKALLLGVSRFISKPINRAKLEACIVELLKETRCDAA